MFLQVRNTKKVEDSELPANKDFREAWVVDEADLTDGVGG